MNICIPVTADRGLESPVSAHFGSAPIFMMVDVATGACRALANANQHHAHGMCQPLAALAGEEIDGMVVGGIGMGALNKLRAAHVQVFISEYPTVAATLAALAAGTLREVTPATACGGHDHGHGHSHG